MTRVDREELLGRIDLPMLADELLGTDRAGARSSMWPCPVATHAQSGRTPPVSIFISRSGEQRWHCHGCGEGGTAIDLVMHSRNVDVGEAIAWLGDRTGTNTTPPRSGPQASRRGEPVRQGPVPGLDDYVKECEAALWHGSSNSLRWLTSTRGLSESVIRANRLGYDPGVSELPRPDGIPRARGIVLPVLDDNGQAIFTQTRRTGRELTSPRYLNCAGRAAPNPRLAFYQCPPEATRGGASDRLVLCEGAIDALTTADAGLHAAALLGSTVTNGSVASNIAQRASAVVIAFDNDQAGDQGAAELAECLAEHAVRTTRLRLPRSIVDVNEWRLKTSRDWVRELRTAVGGTPRSPPGIGTDRRNHQSTAPERGLVL